MVRGKNIVVSFIAVVSLFANLSWANEPAVPLDGITKPVSDVDLSFVQPGKVTAVLVEKGDVVEQGEVLVTLDDEVELIQKKILQDRSENRVPVDLARVELAQNRKNLENVQRAHAKGATSDWEVDQATLAVDTALLNLKVREFEHSQDTLKLESLLGQIERLSIKSPGQGIVEDIMIEPGETVQAMVPVIRLVDINPLKIDLPVPVDQAVTLESGQKATVTFADTTELEATITHIASIADAAAATRTVTLLLENGKDRPAGERVTVLFQEKKGLN